MKSSKLREILEVFEEEHGDCEVLCKSRGSDGDASAPTPFVSNGQFWKKPGQYVVIL